MEKSLGLSQGHSGFLEQRKEFPFEAMMYFRFFTKQCTFVADDDGRITNMFLFKRKMFIMYFCLF